MAPVSFSSRAANCRASSLKALFSTGVSTADLVSPRGRNGSTFLRVSLEVSLEVALEVSWGVSTDVSKSVWCEVSTAMGSGISAVLDSAMPAESACGVGGSLNNS